MLRLELNSSMYFLEGGIQMLVEHGPHDETVVRHGRLDQIEPNIRAARW